MIVILGPTATGKTSLAAQLASRLNGEIISADSRQVYRGMDIGTGKDLSDYVVGRKLIPYHLIDIAEPGYEYSVYEFQRDFKKAYQNIVSRNAYPILCGGTGLYLEAVLKGYRMTEVPENAELRTTLQSQTDDELCTLLSSLKPLHATTDTDSRDRLIRAIEIETYNRTLPQSDTFPEIDSVVFGINYPRNLVRERITQRLEQRLSEGMIAEVENLLWKGVAPERLMAYGLEYKFITQYLIGELSYGDMFRLLNTAIHQFSKRQMTWFRGMERRGTTINWIDGELPMEEKVERVLELLPSVYGDGVASSSLRSE